MAQADISSFTSKLGRRDAGLLAVSGLMATLCGSAAIFLGAWSAAAFVFAMLFPTPLVPTGRSKLFGIDIDKKVADVQICDVWHGMKSCRLVKTANMGLFASPEALVWYVLNIIIHMGPIIIMAFGLWEVCRCFRAMTKGFFFELQAIKHLRNFALSGFFFTLLGPNTQWLCEQMAKGYGPVVSTARALQMHAPGRIIETFTAANFQSSPIFGLVLTSTMLVVFALTLAVITAVMTKAAAIVEDHAQIV